MTHEEKIEYMSLAMGLAHLGFSKEQLDLLVSMYELVVEKEGEADLKSMTAIVLACREREDRRKSEQVGREIKIKSQLKEFMENKKKEEL